MKIDGGCHCGAITYEAELDPEKVGTCNCTDCQTLSGSAFRTIGFVDGEKFRLLSGQPKIYVKTGDSGNRRAQAFCGTCGTPIYASSMDDKPAVYNLRLGTARQRAELKPQKHYWHRSAVPWLGELAEIPTDEKQ